MQFNHGILRKTDFSSQTLTHSLTCIHTDFWSYAYKINRLALSARNIEKNQVEKKTERRNWKEERKKTEKVKNFNVKKNENRED